MVALRVLLLLDFGADPELLVRSHIQKKQTVFPEGRRPKVKDEGVQQLLEFGDDYLAILVEFHLRRLPIAHHALNLVEEALDDLLGVVEEVRVEREAEALVEEEDVVAAQGADLALEAVFAGGVGGDELVDDICEHILYTLVSIK